MGPESDAKIVLGILFSIKRYNTVHIARID